MPRNIIAEDTTVISLLHQHNYRFIDDDLPRTLPELLNGSQIKQFSGRSLSTLVGDHYSMYHFWRKTLRHFSITSSKLEKQFRQIDSETLRRSLVPVHHHEREKEHYMHNSVLIPYRTYEWPCTHSRYSLRTASCPAALELKCAHTRSRESVPRDLNSSPPLFPLNWY